MKKDTEYYIGYKTFQRNWQQYRSSSVFCKTKVNEHAKREGLSFIERHILMLCKTPELAKTREDMLIGITEARFNPFFINRPIPKQHYYRSGVPYEKLVKVFLDSFSHGKEFKLSNLQNKIMKLRYLQKAKT